MRRLKLKAERSELNGKKVRKWEVKVHSAEGIAHGVKNQLTLGLGIELREIGSGKSEFEIAGDYRTAIGAGE